MSADIESVGLFPDIEDTPVFRIQKDRCGSVRLAIQVDLVQHKRMDQCIAKECAAVVRDSCIAQIEGRVSVELPLREYPIRDYIGAEPIVGGDGE